MKYNLPKEFEEILVDRRGRRNLPPLTPEQAEAREIKLREDVRKKELRNREVLNEIRNTRSAEDQAAIIKEELKSWDKDVNLNRVEPREQVIPSDIDYTLEFVEDFLIAWEREKSRRNRYAINFTPDATKIISFLAGPDDIGLLSQQLVDAVGRRARKHMRTTGVDSFLIGGEFVITTLTQLKKELIIKQHQAEQPTTELFPLVLEDERVMNLVEKLGDLLPEGKESRRGEN